MIRPVRPSRVLVDTAAFVALADSRDEHHRPARSVLTQTATEGWRFFTTNAVVAETHGLPLARTTRYQAALFLKRVDAGTTTVVRAASVDERRAREIIRRYVDKAFSLTDATSFAVMERLRIGHAFTFDRHFAQYGFATLIAADQG